MAQTQGNCFICGKTASKATIKKHILKEHNSGDEQCFLMEAKGVYCKGYWLYFSAPPDTALSAIDNFLRHIWCECCGHLSAFWWGSDKFGMSRKLSLLNIGNTLLYEYDFGTTTDITITVVDEISRPAQREKARLLARNVPPRDECVKCGAPATRINAWNRDVFCDRCADTAEDKAALLLITNSPRCGECAYEAESDKWTFDPSGPFPQPVKKGHGGRPRLNK